MKTRNQMTKRTISVFLTILTIIGFIPLFGQSMHSYAETRLPESMESRTLSINWANIKKVGKQNGSGPCACYALAYCRTLLDGKPHQWYEYNRYGKSTSYECSWGKGNYVSTTKSSVKLVLRAVYDQINAGRPTVIHVKNTKGNDHFVAVVGYQNVTNPNNLTTNNILILDSGTTNYTKIYTLAEQKYTPSPNKKGGYQFCYSKTGSVPFSVPEKCVVVFNANGGSVSPYAKEYKGNAVFGSSLPTPKRNGYSFIGWYTEKTGGTAVNASTKVTLSTTLYAHWLSNNLKDASVTAKNSVLTDNNIAVSGLVTVKAGTKTLKYNTDYTLSPVNVKNVGKYTVTVKGKGIYSGTKTTTVTVTPKTPALKTVKYLSSKKALEIVCDPVNVCDKQEIQISKNSNFSPAYTYTVNNYKNDKTNTYKKPSMYYYVSSVTLDGNKENVNEATTYYVRVRAYKTVGSNKIYGSWGVTRSYVGKQTLPAPTKITFPLPTSQVWYCTTYAGHGGANKSAYSSMDITLNNKKSAKGYAVYAVAAGEVINDTYKSSNGQITIKHTSKLITTNGVTFSTWYSTYAHMTNITVKKGTKVKEGQQIGKVGAVGNASDAHLHISFSSGEDGTSWYQTKSTKYAISPYYIYGMVTEKGANTKYLIRNMKGTPITNQLINHKPSKETTKTTSTSNIAATWSKIKTTKITANSARIDGHVDFNKKVYVEKCGFYIGTNKNKLNKDSKPDPINENRSWTDMGYLLANKSLNGYKNHYFGALKSKTTYYYRFYIVANGIEYKSSIYSFTTK